MAVVPGKQQSIPGHGRKDSTVMRLQSTFSIASLLTTAAVGATLGMASVLWTSAPEAGDPSSMPMVVEELTITAPLPAPTVTLRPEREEYLAGETVRLLATVANDSDRPVAVSEAGIFDLAVQRVTSPAPSRSGDVAFLALAEAGDATMVLQPGQARERVITLGSDAPFDEPGRYRVTGSWLGSRAPSEFAAFDVVIAAPESVAARRVRRHAGA